MALSNVLEDDLNSSLSLLEENAPQVTVEGLGSQSQNAATRTGTCCEKCDAPLQSEAVTICRRCGWYASLGIFVEVDPNWEKLSDPRTEAPEPQPTSHLQVWIKLIPKWGWIVIASVMVVILESIIARFATPTGSSLRTAWSLTQLTVGIITVILCHILNFMLLAADDADVGLLDLLLKPLRLWTRTCQQLPKRLWFFDALICGLTAALMSPLVIGGIPYERFWDWGFKEPVKQNLMGAVMDRAKQIEAKDQSLEDAIQDFAGKGNLDEPQNKPKEAPKQKADCVILGYQVDREGRLTTLLLGTAHRTKLVFAGRVEPKLSDDEMTAMLASLKPLVVREPFISIAAENVVWVKPKFTCRVTYREQLKSGSLRDIGWGTMLGDMKIK